MPPDAPNPPDAVRPGLRIAQFVRDLDASTGVGAVVTQLDAHFRAAGVPTVVVTLDHLRLGGLAHLRRVNRRLATLVEVVVYSAVAPLVWWLRYRREWVTISHNDSIVGDIYVNHGVHRAVVRPRTGPARPRMLIDPLHLFLWWREALRFRLAAHRVVVNFSDHGTAELGHYFSIRGFRTAVIPNGVDLERFAPRPQARAPLRTQLGIPDGTFVALLVANEFKRKGVDVLADALRQAPPGVAGVVVGGTSAMIRHARARHRDLADRLVFAGRQTLRLPEFYAAADVFVLPTAQEAWPLVLLEAMAGGLPCVTTPVSSIPELITDDVNGVLVDRSADAVATVLDDLRRDPVRTRRLAEAAAATAQRYAWATIAQRYLDLAGEVDAAR